MKSKNIKNKPNWKMIIVVLTLFSMSIVALFQIIVSIPEIHKTLCSEGQAEIEVIEDCKNLTLEETAYCLRDWLEGFYNYTLRKDTIKTLEDIKKNGGDCFDYAKLYERTAKDLGFLADTHAIYNKENTFGHRYAIIWDDEFSGYCKLDMLSVDCFKFNRRTNETE